MTCEECGKQFVSYIALQVHTKVHQGLTICQLCGKVASKVAHLRRHMAGVHKLSREETMRLVPTRPRTAPDGQQFDNYQ